MPLSTIQSTTTLAHRNMLTNGDFMIWQRNAVATQTGSGGVKPIDGWRQAQSNVGQLSTQTERFSDAPANTGLKYCLKMTVKTVETALAATEDSTILTKLEGFDCQKLMYGTANAKNTVLSFWVKSSIAGTFSVNIYMDNTAGNRAIAKPYTINSANTWEYKTLSFPGNPVGVPESSSEPEMQISWYIAAGANSVGGSNGDVWHNYTANKFAFGHTQNAHVTTDESTFQLTGVQFEIGHVATPFEFKSFEENLARCQRYLRNIGTIRHQGANGVVVGQTIPLEPTMRVQPVVTGTNSTGGAHSIAGTGAFPNSTQIIYSGTAATSGSTSFLQFTNVIADAEL